MGIYGDNIISQHSILDVSRNPSKWSHSWAMRKQKKTINISNGETTSLCWEKNKLTVTGWLEVTMRTKNLKMNGMT